jgi:hypothetical protein
MYRIIGSIILIVSIEVIVYCMMSYILPYVTYTLLCQSICILSDIEDPLCVNCNNVSNYWVYSILSPSAMIGVIMNTMMCIYYIPYLWLLVITKYYILPYTTHIQNILSFLSFLVLLLCVVGYTYKYNIRYR